MKPRADFGAEEGEIQEAIPLPQSRQGPRVDRSERSRFARSGEIEQSNRRRSRSPRGSKRGYNDRENRRNDRNYHGSDYYGRDNQGRGYGDSRRQPYHDVDRPTSRGNHSNSDERPYKSHNGYDHRRYDRDMYSDENSNTRNRRRSRSPHNRNERGRNGNDYLAAQIGSHVRSNVNYTSANGRGYLNASDRNGYSGQTPDKDSSSYQASDLNMPSQDADVDFDWDPAQEKDKEAEEQAEIERRRRMREAILKRTATSTATQVREGTEQTSTTPESTQVNTPGPMKTEADAPGSAANDNMSPMLSPTTDGFDLGKTGFEASSVDASPSAAGPSAADYDPTADMREDERRDELRHGHVGLHGEPRELSPASPKTAPAETETEEEAVEFDMFAEDLDEQTIEAAATKLQAQAQTIQRPTRGKGGIDGDDSEGYYRIQRNDVLAGRYRIVDALGSGMFSGVARAEDTQNNNKVVAIKIIRNNDALRKAGFKEIAILQKLNYHDPQDKAHIVRYDSYFEYRGHLCMVFESLEDNLREIVKKFGRVTGLNLRAVKTYAWHMFTALAHFEKHEIIHADLKPDNILVNASKSMVKVCDLGTAIDRSDAATVANDVTPYLVSRFYRAPEVIMGAPFDYAIDVWSIGCTLYELYTGKILFAGQTNNQMLRRMQEIRGKINIRLQKRGQLSDQHFDQAGNFISKEPDHHSGTIHVRTISHFPQTSKLRTMIMEASKGQPESRDGRLNAFIDLLDRCLALAPEKRITAAQALRHEFFRTD